MSGSTRSKFRRYIPAVLLIVLFLATVAIVIWPNVTPGPLPQPTASVSATPTPIVKMTEGQQQAVGKAEEYLSFIAFSKDGLVFQLVTFDKFARADAKFAVNHIKVDWNEQAVKKAQSYLDSTHFSREGLIAQLKHDKFTDEQAKLGTEKAFSSAE